VWLWWAGWSSARAIVLRAASARVEAPGNNFLSHACEIPSGEYVGGQYAMDNLPSWGVWIAAAAVGVAPGLAILSAPTIGRLLYRLLWPRSEVLPDPETDPAH
jgi:hypothetical protein